MATISVTLPSDGNTIDAADVNNPINTIVSAINGGIDSNNITAGGVVPNSLTSGTGTSWALQSWTPTWTNMVVSNSTVTAKYIQVGKIVFYRISVVLASTDKPSGSVKFTLPVTSVSYAGTATLPEIGRNGFFIGAFAYRGVVVWADTTHGQLTVTTASGSYAFDAPISATVPDTFAAGSELHATGSYEAA